MWLKGILHLKSEAVKDVIYLFVFQIVDKILPLVVIPYLMIVLGSEKYGYIGFSTAVIQYIILIVDFGFNLSATKKIAIAQQQGKMEVSKIFLSTFYAKLILLLVSTFVVVIILITIPPIKRYSFTVLCMYPMVIGTILTPTWLFQGIGRIRLLAVISSLSKLIILPLIFLFVNNDKDYNLAALIQSSVYFFAGAISVLIIIRLNLISLVKIPISYVKNEIQESFPLFLSSAATSAYTQLFTVILGLTSTPVVVGRFSAAEKIMRSLCFAIYNPINTAFYPRVSSLSSKNRHEASIKLNDIAGLVLTLMLLLSVVLFFFAKPISIVLGDGYEGVDFLLKILSPAPVAIALGAVFGQMGLVAMGNKETVNHFKTVYFYAALISLALVTILSWKLADTGAAIALVLTEYFVFISMRYLYRKNSICC